MFTDDFDPIAALAATSCPRCVHQGLESVNEEAYLSHPSQDRKRAAIPS